MAPSPEEVANADGDVVDVSMDVVGDQVTVWVLATPVPESATV